MNGLDSVSRTPVPTAGGQRLLRAYRLDPAGYKSTFDGGESLTSRFFAMWILRSQEGGVGRVGTVASKRTFHDAVDRNRARRLLREAYRTGRAHLKPGVQLVLVGRHRILEASSRDVAEAFERTCRKAGIWEG